MLFVATLCSKVPLEWNRLQGSPRSAYRLLIEAPSWDVARRFAQSRDPKAVTVLATSDDKGLPDVELRWDGDDFNHGGGPEGKRLQWRPYPDEIATEWKDF